MSSNRSRGTECELLLCRELRRLGLRFRRNVTTLPGKPDVVFPKAKLAVFCDGDFWHGRNWRQRRVRLACGANADYWVAKIRANMARDRNQRKKLRRAGWTVVRVWESQIQRDPSSAARRLCRTCDLSARQDSC